MKKLLSSFLLIFYSSALFALPSPGNYVVSIPPYNLLVYSYLECNALMDSIGSAVTMLKGVGYIPCSCEDPFFVLGGAGYPLHIYVKHETAASCGPDSITVTSISVACPAGEHAENYTTCVPDAAVSLVETCAPSIRTVAPCPSGFAPAAIEPLVSAVADPYLSEFDTMPVQDMLYSIGVCLFGLLGISVGVKLL
jgi:hypothetical protein